MSFSFSPAKRESVGLLIMLAGPSGGGKTYSALELATGICGDRPFAVIDTEARRALHYADKFRFDHGDLRPPFSPQAYIEAIKVADERGYPAIVVDSMSHEWSGEGGVLDMQEAELDRMAGDNWQKREAVKMAAWIKPKTSHKEMVQKFLQTRAHLIFCLRAEEKVKMVKDQNGKVQIVHQGFQPICDKGFPFEATVSFLLLPENPGVGQLIKLQEQHRVIFPAGAKIDCAAGRRIAEWASGSAPAAPVSTKAPIPPSSIVSHETSPESPEIALQPKWHLIRSDGKFIDLKTRDAWLEKFMQVVQQSTDAEALTATRVRNGSVLMDLSIAGEMESVAKIEAAITGKIDELRMPFDDQR